MREWDYIIVINYKNMKKLVIALIALSFLTSCGNKNEDIKTETWSTETWVTETWSSNIDENENDESTEVENSESGKSTNVADDIKTKSKNKSTNVNSSTGTTNVNAWKKTEDKTDVSADDAALEKEVNGLLDEFINSLDNYEK